MKRLLLVGAGHAHALVLRGWVGAPLPGVELVVVSPQPFAPYSGMVPGWLAGRYRFDEIGIDFRRLAAAAGAQFVADELWALDTAAQRVRLASGATLDFDLLSLNVGSTLNPPPPPAGTTMLALRPLSMLHDRWTHVLERWRRGDGAGDPFTVTAVGGGAAGFEALLAVLARLRAERPDCRVRGRLVSRSATLLPGFAPAAVRAAHRALAAAGVELRLGTDWDADAHAGDLVLWATGAQPQAWQTDPARRGGLAVSEAGFVRVDATLRSVSHPAVFAAGDCAAWAEPLPKAGVYAVRMGPVLARNLRAALGAGDAARYAPQRRFLALLATGDGRAIGARGGIGFAGRWVWWWKDRIDRGFIRRFDVGHIPARRAAADAAGPG